ncbi:hypothetical protein [Shewanella sp. GD04112]|uniref:hypothetical protein n=1 Tax=Shewanella sp. GD04112 TaxID=2975434 RepID=UPI00244938B9|nr:hypothetical protein [Shewanella sp. GD04112]MDH0450749.1 hypothetical protein [Shewanella sp. GD04112]
MHLFVPIGFFIALVLAIPTFGVSIIVFFVLKFYIDLQGVSSIVAAAFNAERTDETVVAPFVTNTAIRKFFKNYGTTENKYDSFFGAGLTFIGYVQLANTEIVVAIVKSRDATFISTYELPYQFGNDLNSQIQRKECIDEIATAIGRPSAAT